MSHVARHPGVEPDQHIEHGVSEMKILGPLEESKFEIPEFSKVSHWFARLLMVRIRRG